MSRRESLYLSAGLLVAFVLIAGSVYLLVGDPRYRPQRVDRAVTAGRFFVSPAPLPTRAVAAGLPTSLPAAPAATAVLAVLPAPVLVPTATNSPTVTAASAPAESVASPMAGPEPAAANLDASSPSVQNVPTATATAAGTLLEPLAPAAPQPGAVTLNGLPLDEFVILSDAARQHVRDLYEQGQALGRDGRAFSRLGASTFATYHFLGRWDDGPYKLGDYAYLEPAIAYFSGSFAHLGQAAKVGLTSWGALDPIWATDRPCHPAESPLACEIRLHNPAVLLIGLGTNDIAPGTIFERHMRQILEECIDQGVIPILATKADRYEGEDNRNNETVRRLAADYLVPLWDFDLVAGTLPGRGVGRDEVHLGFYDPYDYTVPAGFKSGYGLFNLSALMALHEVYRALPLAAASLPAATLAVDR